MWLEEVQVNLAELKAENEPNKISEKRRIMHRYMHELLGE